MATLPYSQSSATTYDDTYAGYGGGSTGAPETTHRSLGPQIFIWLAWAAAAFFWGATLTTGLGIVSAITSHPGRVDGGADAGGLGWFLTDVLGGLVILGLAIAWGMYRYNTRDKSKDALTERATANLYDTVEANGGEDLTSRSPEARDPLDRDANRASPSDFGPDLR